MKPVPPQRPLKFLRWFCREDYLEEIEGDLTEVYEKQFEISPLKARWKFIWSVVRYFRPEFMKSFKTFYQQNTTAMFQHNLLITFRNFLRNKSAFAINLAGLTSGLACVLLIILWVTDEMQIDKYHVKGERLYQIMSNHTDASGVSTWKGVPGLLLEEIQERIPEVENATACTDAREFTLSADDTYLKANGKFASKDFFDVFTFPLLTGTKKNALTDKSGIVITQSLSERLFKTSDAIGRSVTWHAMGETKALQVTGVMEDVPQNSSEPFDFLMSWDYYHDDLITFKQWGNYYARIMVVLNTTEQEETAGANIDAIFRQNSLEDNVGLFIAKYQDKYLYNKYENGTQAGGRIEYVELFSMVALFILFIASVNYINLTTARASTRAREVSVKKTFGASRRSLMTQYFGESVLLSLISIILAIFLVWLVLPQFNIIAQKLLVLSINREFILTAAALVFTVGILAGCYPAIFMSGLTPANLQKGGPTKGAGMKHGRKALVVVQFTLSIILIAAVTVVYQQMDFVKNKNLGYNKDNLVYIEREGKFTENYGAFVNELKNTPGIRDAAVSGFHFEAVNSTGGIDWQGKTPEDQIQFQEINSGHGLIELLGVELLTGRTFFEKFGADSSNVIINEAAVNAMNMEDPIGKTITHYTGEKTIVGVVKDFNLKSLHTQIGPMVFLYHPQNAPFIMARLEQGNEAMAIENMEKLYKKFNPGYVFGPKFIDQDYQSMYKSEETVSVLARYFTVLAILISCLGLFGLASFTTAQRMKEIGVRKILGAGVFGIIWLLSRDFTKIVLIAIVIALPTGYYISEQWLKNFAYRTDLSWWGFIGAGLAALLIAWITIGLQTLKAANANPVDCLKDE